MDDDPRAATEPPAPDGPDGWTSEVTDLWSLPPSESSRPPGGTADGDESDRNDDLDDLDDLGQVEAIGRLAAILPVLAGPAPTAPATPDAVSASEVPGRRSLSIAALVAVLVLLHGSGAGLAVVVHRLTGTWPGGSRPAVRVVVDGPATCPMYRVDAAGNRLPGSCFVVR